MDLVEFVRRWKRAFDGYLNYRKAIIITTLTLFILFYLSPNVLHVFPPSNKQITDVIERCLDDRLAPYELENSEFNANIRYIPNWREDTSFIPFVGNGLIGVSISTNAPMYVVTPKALLQPLEFQPLVHIDAPGHDYKEAIVSHYVTGTVTRFQCFRNGLFIKYEYMAHRTIPHLFIQDIKIINPTADSMEVSVSQPRTFWPSATKESYRFPGKSPGDYVLLQGLLDNPFPGKTDEVLAFGISYRDLPNSIVVKAKGEISVPVYTTVYHEAISKWEYEDRKAAISKRCQNETQRIASMNLSKLKDDHVKVWTNLWKTGMSISFSKAAGAINGDKINATMYYVLSSVRSRMNEINTTATERNNLLKLLEHPEGCYGYHHTLQAPNLWSSLTDMSDVTRLVSYWLLTLEKQGCHKLVSAGAEGVLQALVLSFGGFRFTRYHLEFNIHPKFLHRDYHFRRINYGNNLHLNVTVTLQENNKALLGVSVNKSDEKVYACNGGCLSNLVELHETTSYFPVILTEPITAILYVTKDKKHMELFKKTLHMKDVAEAPAHEHHVISLHRHGHPLGGLPTLFWASVCFLIVVFHLFLFKLIYNEYCGKQPSHRTRYGKL